MATRNKAGWQPRQRTVQARMGLTWRRQTTVRLQPVHLQSLTLLRRNFPKARHRASEEPGCTWRRSSPCAGLRTIRPGRRTGEHADELDFDYHVRVIELPKPGTMPPAKLPSRRRMPN